MSHCPDECFHDHGAGDHDRIRVVLFTQLLPDHSVWVVGASIPPPCWEPSHIFDDGCFHVVGGYVFAMMDQGLVPEAWLDAGNLIMRKIHQWVDSLN